MYHIARLARPSVLAMSGRQWLTSRALSEIAVVGICPTARCTAVRRASGGRAAGTGVMYKRALSTSADASATRAGQSSGRNSLLRGLAYLSAGLVVAEVAFWASSEASAPAAEEQTLSNWSGTQHVDCARYAQPDTLDALQRAVEWAHTYRRRIRPVGSAISPNGAAFNAEGMLSLALLDDVVRVDREAMTVTVQAGARVRELVEKLRPHGLTLQNYASIREQQIGGFTQVGAHGNGATIPPLDETVTALKLVTPGRGTLELSEAAEPETFRMARCGIGALGVAAEVTLQCVPAHRLLERTWTATHGEIDENHARWLKENQHLRYMWIPYTETVVVVGSNPLPDGAEVPEPTSGYAGGQPKKVEPMVRLLKEVAPAVDPAGMGFGELRDELLKVSPLDVGHVRRCNAAEAEFWRRNAGTRCDWSDQILGFDCGGEQHVYEVAFRTGDDVDSNTRKDLAYMKDLLAMIDREEIPAPAPIEQRWTAGSSSPLSPATNDGCDPAKPGLYSWVGIIMYLPTSDPATRSAITDAFKSFARKEEATLGGRYGIRTHWAKIELPEGEDERRAARETLEQRYPCVQRFKDLRSELDPRGVLGNDLIEGLLGDPERVPRAGQARSGWLAPGEYAEAVARAVRRATAQ